LEFWTAFTVHPGGKAVESVDGAYRFDLDRAFPEAATQEAEAKAMPRWPATPEVAISQVAAGAMSRT